MSISQNLRVCTNIARKSVAYTFKFSPTKNITKLYNAKIPLNFLKLNILEIRPWIGIDSNYKKTMLLKVRDASEDPGCKPIPNCRIRVPKKKEDCPSPPGKDPCKKPDPCKKINNSCKDPKE
ncbi:uncharacterized protein LOC130892724 [Diorhabda carinulata]|uniref:uncharacterized protein LOC130892724 n=1 Tax=Diorhabda carinulata TaxID=1163345 RepID=UPI0025A1E681|nr:uncharacterized protein LOC130892724 [Diorhabda carinulata]